jgi:prevent-host-death family protein
LNQQSDNYSIIGYRISERDACANMKTVSARQANDNFSELLARVQRGEKILITKRSKPIAVLCPYQPPQLTPEREAAIKHAAEVMAQGLPWGAAIRAFTRDEMHEKWSALIPTSSSK